MLLKVVMRKVEVQKGEITSRCFQLSRSLLFQSLHLLQTIVLWNRSVLRLWTMSCYMARQVPTFLTKIMSQTIRFFLTEGCLTHWESFLCYVLYFCWCQNWRKAISCSWCGHLPCLQLHSLTTINILKQRDRQPSHHHLQSRNYFFFFFFLLGIGG